MIRDLADVSINLQLNPRAIASPSAHTLAIDVSNEAKPRTRCRNLSFAIQIALVANYYDREIVLVLDPQNLLLEYLYLLEAFPVSD